MEIIEKLLLNVVLLFGLTSILGLSNFKFNQKKLSLKVISGVIIGILTILIMMNAFELETGAIFDTRSVIISVTALFFSPITAGLATLIAIIYRIIIGGYGVYAGVLTLIVAFVIGILWKKIVSPYFKQRRFLSFYLFGLLVHIGMLLSQLILPYPKNLEVIALISPVVMIVFPLAVMFLAEVILIHDRRITSQREIELNEKKFSTLVNNTTLGIVQYNNEGVIIFSNQRFAEILDVDLAQLIGLDMTKLPNKSLVNKLLRALKGVPSVYNDYYRSHLSERVFPTRVKFSPIYDGEAITGGIGIIEDLTKEKELHKNIEMLKKQDLLTKLFNRATFDEFVLSTDKQIFYPLSIVTCDINAFQVINTTFGYDAGNDVLIDIANIFIDFSRERYDMSAYRIGGDEFAIIMMNTTNEQANEYIEKINRKIKLIDKFDININVSFGISTSKDASTPIIDVFNDSLSDMMTNKVYDGSSISMKTIDLIMNTMFVKNKREKMHSERVSFLSRKIAEKFKLGTAFIKRTELAGRLHDIGKITISEDILDKPGKLSDSEWKKIRKHPETSFKLLSSVPEYLDIATIVFAHHERWDGKGYPRALSVNQIPLEARIICVADTIDAMTTDRPYRDAMTLETAIKEVKSESGKQFDPQVVDIVLALYKNNQL